MNVLVIVLYLIAMVVIGLWAARRARTLSRVPTTTWRERARPRTK